MLVIDFDRGSLAKLFVLDLIKEDQMFLRIFKVCRSLAILLLLDLIYEDQLFLHQFNSSHRSFV